MNLRLPIAFVVVSFLSTPLFTQGFHDNVTKRHEAEKADQSKPVAGSVSLAVKKSYQDTFDFVVNWLKKEGFTIEEADAVKGQISTPIEQTKGGYSQKGSRVMVTLIKENDATTTLRVVVAEYGRKKLLAADAWSNPKADDDKTKELAELLKAALSG
jgi:hypothetical protein